MHELTQVMRQKDDLAFSELLCRVRTDSCTSDDIRILKTREISVDAADYPTQALHVYRLNADVDARNSLMLNSLAPQTAQYTIKAIDSVAGQTSHLSLSCLSDKRSETGGLHGTLKLAIGARVMLTANVDVSDDLVKGARGEVVHVNNNSEITSVLVRFDNDRVGLKTIQTSQYSARHPHAVPLSKYEVVFFAKGKRGSEIKRLQFPLTLAWATTIHKVQGLTLNEIVVDMKGGRFSPGQAYVAFSRVKTLAGLHILHFNPKAIRKNIDVEHEMVRLNSNLLQPRALPEVSCDSSHVTIALLNVRSIVPKLPNVRADNNLRSASILCFCETWLNASQHSPVLPDDQVDIRCDRMTCENKGGVLMCVPS